MNYRIHFDAAAEADLAAIWTAATDRLAVTTAAAWFEMKLARAPLRLGEARSSSVRRIAFHHPLGMEFEVIEDDKLVLVHSIFSTA